MVAQPILAGLMKRLPIGSVWTILPRLLKLGQTHADEIKNSFPKVLRRVGGYNIDALTPDAMANRPGGMPGDGIHCASSGVGRHPAYSSRITLKLSPLPAQKVMALCHFPSLQSYGCGPASGDAGSSCG